ncbi:MAG: deoxyribodipyrimidine photo-lyase [Acidobacteria bacterium]|nr:MAG: deoxyribodipyrimidine photo-lyase [Acidobacteriota bacterium]
MTVALVWLRDDDLRCADNPALALGASSAEAVVPVFAWPPGRASGRAPGAAARWWLHHSLAALEAELAERGSRLVLRHGPVAAELVAVATACRARLVVWNRPHTPPARRLRDDLVGRLAECGIEGRETGSGLLHDPDALRTSAGGPWKVFTPFWKALRRTLEPVEPVAGADPLPAPARWPASCRLEEFALLPRVRWDEGLEDCWTPGRSGALARLERFLEHGLARYRDERDRPAAEAVSRLSPHLRFGEIGAREVWHAVRRHQAREGLADEVVEPFLRQLAWREFGAHLLYHFPHTIDEPLDRRFGSFPWRHDEAALAAWSRGRTGYPIVDAGMRELWRTGWMHNRVRMIVASLLTRHLLIPWQAGARWFEDTLVDADPGNNTLGWQWTAGCGADAAPYFRVFNPVLQGRRFDPDGAYVRRWVPEIAALPDRFVHEPWAAPDEVRKKAKVVLGETYPAPVIEHPAGRRRALAAWESWRAGLGDRGKVAGGAS